VNPRIGSGLQYGRRVEEEQTVEVVGNHGDGTRMGSGLPIPKERRDAAATRRSAVPGDGLLGLYDGGAIFGQPHERKPGVSRVARTGSDGKDGAKGQEGRANHTETCGKRTDRGSSRTGVRQRAPRSWRATVNGREPEPRSGSSPHGRAPHDMRQGADPVAARERRCRAGHGLLRQSGVSAPAKGGGRAARQVSPLKTT